MRFTTSILTVALAAFVAASPLDRRTATAILSDLKLTGGALTSLNNAIGAFPATGNGTLALALAINTAAGAVGKSINNTITDTEGTNSFSPPDSKAVLGGVQALVPFINIALDGIFARRNGFKALPAGGVVNLVVADLKSLNSGCDELEAKLLPLYASAADKSQATVISKAIDAKFAATLAGFV